MKIATFNINNINKSLNNLLSWLAKAEPDVVGLQELRAEQRTLPADALRIFGYEAGKISKPPPRAAAGLVSSDGLT